MSNSDGQIFPISGEDQHGLGEIEQVDALEGLLAQLQKSAEDMQKPKIPRWHRGYISPTEGEKE